MDSAAIKETAHQFVATTKERIVEPLLMLLEERFDTLVAS